jgi:hypothetical protein
MRDQSTTFGFNQTIKENPKGKASRRFRWGRLLLAICGLMFLYYAYCAWMTIVSTDHDKLNLDKIIKDNPATKHFNKAKEKINQGIEHVKTIHKNYNKRQEKELYRKMEKLWKKKQNKLFEVEIRKIAKEFKSRLDARLINSEIK